jgi:predicted DNA binding CopG/RHH family protein
LTGWKTGLRSEAFLERDLSDLDFSQFKPVQFEFQAKPAQFKMRVPKGLLDAVKQRAKSRAFPTPASSANSWSKR